MWGYSEHTWRRLLGSKPDAAYYTLSPHSFNTTTARLQETHTSEHIYTGNKATHNPCTSTQATRQYSVRWRLANGEKQNSGREKYWKVNRTRHPGFSPHTAVPHWEHWTYGGIVVCEAFYHWVLLGFSLWRICFGRISIAHITHNGHTQTHMKRVFSAASCWSYAQHTHTTHTHRVMHTQWCTGILSTDWLCPTFVLTELHKHIYIRTFDVYWDRINMTEAVIEWWRSLYMYNACYLSHPTYIYCVSYHAVLSFVTRQRCIRRATYISNITYNKITVSIPQKKGNVHLQLHAIALRYAWHAVTSLFFWHRRWKQTFQPKIHAFYPFLHNHVHHNLYWCYLLCHNKRQLAALNPFLQVIWIVKLGLFVHQVSK